MENIFIEWNSRMNLMCNECDGDGVGGSVPRSWARGAFNKSLSNLKCQFVCHATRKNEIVKTKNMLQIHAHFCIQLLGYNV